MPTLTSPDAPVTPDIKTTSGGPQQPDAKTTRDHARSFSLVKILPRFLRRNPGEPTAPGSAMKAVVDAGNAVNSSTDHQGMADQAMAELHQDGANSQFLADQSRVMAGEPTSKQVADEITASGVTHDATMQESQAAVQNAQAVVDGAQRLGQEVADHELASDIAASGVQMDANRQNAQAAMRDAQTSADSVQGLSEEATRVAGAAPTVEVEELQGEANDAALARFNREKGVKPKREPQIIDSVAVPAPDASLGDDIRAGNEAINNAQSINQEVGRMEQAEDEATVASAQKAVADANRAARNAEARPVDWDNMSPDIRAQAELADDVRAGNEALSNARQIREEVDAAERADVIRPGDEAIANARQLNDEVEQMERAETEGVINHARQINQEVERMQRAEDEATVASAQKAVNEANRISKGIDGSPPADLDPLRWVNRDAIRPDGSDHIPGMQYPLPPVGFRQNGSGETSQEAVTADGAIQLGPRGSSSWESRNPERATVDAAQDGEAIALGPRGSSSWEARNPERTAMDQDAVRSQEGPSRAVDMDGMPIGDGAVRQYDDDGNIVVPENTSWSRLEDYIPEGTPPERRRLLKKIGGRLKDAGKNWVDKFDVVTKQGRADKNMKYWAVGAALGTAQGIAAFNLGPFGVPAKLGLSLAVNYGSAKIFERAFGKTDEDRNKLYAARARDVMKGKNESEWTDEDRATVTADREKFDAKRAAGQKKLKSFLQGYTAGGTLTSLGLAVDQSFMNGAVSSFVENRTGDVASGAARVGSAIGEGIGNAGEFIGDKAGDFGEMVADKAGDIREAVSNMELRSPVTFGDNESAPVSGGEQVRGPIGATDTYMDRIVGESQPSSLGEMVKAPIGGEAPPPVPEIPQVEIKSGDTLTSILKDKGVNINNPADYYNSLGKVLDQDWQTFESFRQEVGQGAMPFSHDELQTVMQDAMKGNQAAQGKLIEAAHWIKAGGKIGVPVNGGNV